jgi:hypothetical protein
MAPKGPYKLCTVNKVPARAKILIGRVVEDVKEEYTILYVANSESRFPVIVFYDSSTWQSLFGLRTILLTVFTQQSKV